MTKRAKIWWLVGILVVAVAGGGGAVIKLRAADGRIEVLPVKDTPGPGAGPNAGKRGTHGRPQP